MRERLGEWREKFSPWKFVAQAIKWTGISGAVGAGVVELRTGDLDTALVVAGCVGVSLVGFLAECVMVARGR